MIIKHFVENKYFCRLQEESESEESDSDDEDEGPRKAKGVESLIEIENPNRKKRCMFLNFTLQFSFYLFYFI